MSERVARRARPGTDRPLEVALATSLGVLAIGAALSAREWVSVWVSTGCAGAVVVALALGSAWGDVSARLRVSPHHLLEGLVVGVAMTLATHALFPVGVALLPALTGSVARLYADLQAPPGPVLALPVLVVVATSEELLFRGALVPMLERRAVSRLGVTALATLVYALPQIASGSPVLVGASLVCGAIWTAQSVRARSIVPGLVAHLVWDVLVFVALPLV